MRSRRPCGPYWPAARRPLSRAKFRPQVGLWLSVWWTKDDEFHHWANCTRLPSAGRYSAGEEQVIARQEGQFRGMGIDFLILDDTNGVGAAFGRHEAAFGRQDAAV